MLQPGMFDLRLYGFSGGLRNLKLYRALSLVLHDDRTCSDLIAMAHFPDFESRKVACAQLAVYAEVEQR